jgi:hypothetical protein
MRQSDRAGAALTGEISSTTRSPARPRLPADSPPSREPNSAHGTAKELEKPAVTMNGRVAAQVVAGGASLAVAWQMDVPGSYRGAVRCLCV